MKTLLIKLFALTFCLVILIAGNIALSIVTMRYGYGVEPKSIASISVFAAASLGWGMAMLGVVKAISADIK